jgi:hypothetical protein
MDVVGEADTVSPAVALVPLDRGDQDAVIAYARRFGPI